MSAEHLVVAIHTINIQISTSNCYNLPILKSQNTLKSAQAKTPSTLDASSCKLEFMLGYHIHFNIKTLLRSTTLWLVLDKGIGGHLSMMMFENQSFFALLLFLFDISEYAHDGKHIIWTYLQNHGERSDNPTFTSKSGFGFESFLGFAFTPFKDFPWPFGPYFSWKQRIDCSS